MEKNDAVDTLIAAMTDNRLPVPVRIGAARGLAHIGSAQEQLCQIEAADAQANRATRG
ncbi:TPA: hypothetical protein L4E84_005430 [Pseudomonas aeruginosa]|nr:hypothetical protein [Pseudomonas aeruginosa]